MPKMTVEFSMWDWYTDSDADEVRQCFQELDLIACPASYVIAGRPSGNVLALYDSSADEVWKHMPLTNIVDSWINEFPDKEFEEHDDTIKKANSIIKDLQIVITKLQDLIQKCENARIEE